MDLAAFVVSALGASRGLALLGPRRRRGAAGIAAGMPGLAMAWAASNLERFPLWPTARHAVRRSGVVGRVAKLPAHAALTCQADAAVVVGKPLQYGASGAVWKTARLVLTAAVPISVLPSRERGHTIATRSATLLGGRASACDPTAVFTQQRKRAPVDTTAGMAASAQAKPIR